MSKSFARLPVWLLVALLPLVADAARVERPDMKLQLDGYSLAISDYCFASGLRILLQEDHSQPIVSYTQVIDQGSDADPVGLEGIAHLVEHLWFRSFREDEVKVWDKIHQYGGNINAYTANDVTVYMTVAPKESLTEMMALEARRIMGADAVIGVTPLNTQEEREIVRNELRMNYENSARVGMHYLYGKLYPEGHPYARMGIGTHDSLDKIEHQDIVDFVANNYLPKNATMMVVGDFSIDEMGQIIQETFPEELLIDPNNPDGPLVDQSYCKVRVEREPEAPPPPVDQTLTYHTAGVEKPTIIMGWSLPSGFTSNDSLMGMTVGMMAGAMQSYLDPDWRWEEDSLEDLESVGCWFSPQQHGSEAVCFIEINDVEKAEEKLEMAANGLYLLWDMNQRPFQKYMFSYSSMSSMAGLFRTVEDVSSLGSVRATEAANFTHFTGDGQYFSRQFEWLNGVDGGDAPAFAREYLNRDRFVAVVLEPYAEDELLIDSSDALYVGRPFEGIAQTVDDPALINKEFLDNLIELPPYDQLIEYDLDNGLHVVMLPYGTAPLVRTSLRFTGGEAMEPLSGISEFADTFSRVEIGGSGNTPLRMAGTWSGVGGETYEGLGIIGSSKNLDGQLYLLRMGLDGWIPDMSDRKDWKKSALKSLHYNRTFPEYWASWQRWNRLLPGHPLVEGVREETIQQIMTYGKGQAKGWHESVFRPDNGTLYVVGRMDVESAKAEIERYLGSWSGEDEASLAPADPPGAPEPGDRTVVVINKPGVSQTSVNLSCQVTPETLAGKAEHAVLGTLMSQLSWLALREQSAVSYGAGAGVSAFAGGTSVLSFGTLVQNGAAGFATETFLGLAKKVQDESYDASLLATVKSSNARNYVIGQQTTGEMLGRLAYPHRKGWGDDYWKGYTNRLAAVTQADLKAQVERCVGHEVVTLLGPEEIITPQLDEIGVPYEVFDWKAEADVLWERHDPKTWKKELKKRAKAEKKKAKEEAKEAKEKDESGEE